MAFLNAELSIIQAQASSAETLDIASQIPRWRGKDNIWSRDSKVGGSGGSRSGNPPAAHSVQKVACTLCDDTHVNGNVAFFKCRKFHKCL